MDGIRGVSAFGFIFFYSIDHSIHKTVSVAFYSVSASRFFTCR
jgi:hypothetical protein